MTIDSLAALREVYSPHAPVSRFWTAWTFTAAVTTPVSAFYVLSSARADGRADASQRGDPPGSLADVPGDRTLLLLEPAGKPSG